MKLFFFDFDKTLYAYDFRRRLPAMAAITGQSEYHLASTWWAAGYERRAESGQWPLADEYLAQFEEVTGARLTLEQWCAARQQASTPIAASLDALALAGTLGTVALLSNNPSPFAESLGVLAPEVAAAVGERSVISCALGIRKPDPAAFLAAAALVGADPADCFFADDAAANVDGAIAAGMTAHHLVYSGGIPQVPAMVAAITGFAERTD